MLANDLYHVFIIHHENLTMTKFIFISLKLMRKTIALKDDRPQSLLHDVC